jgi:uncharacterized Zn finger protein
MKPIKCPNCGEKMQPKVHENTFIECDPMAWISCPNCGVHGPAGVGKTERGAVRAAERLMREWIARMEANLKHAEEMGWRKAARVARYGGEE